MTTDLVDKLEAFNNAHKARSVNISVGNGYGATCWEVTLRNEKRTIIAAECSFFELPEAEGHLEDIPYWKGKNGELVVFASDSDDDNWDWPGLKPVLEIALKVAELMELPFRYSNSPS